MLDPRLKLAHSYFCTPAVLERVLFCPDGIEDFEKPAYLIQIKLSVFRSALWLYSHGRSRVSGVAEVQGLNNGDNRGAYASAGKIKVASLIGGKHVSGGWYSSS